MTFGKLLHEFFSDDKVLISFVLIILDFILGVAAALKVGTFKFAYFSDFLKTDVLGKLLPYFVLYAGALVAGSAHLVIPGLDVALIAGLAYAALVTAFVGSILSSLKDLGVPLPKYFGSEKPPPGP